MRHKLTKQQRYRRASSLAHLPRTCGSNPCTTADPKKGEGGRETHTRRSEIHYITTYVVCLRMLSFDIVFSAPLELLPLPPPSSENGKVHSSTPRSETKKKNVKLSLFAENEMQMHLTLTKRSTHAKKKKASQFFAKSKIAQTQIKRYRKVIHNQTISHRYRYQSSRPPRRRQRGRHQQLILRRVKCKQRDCLASLEARDELATLPLLK